MITMVAIADGSIVGFSKFNPDENDLRALYVASNYVGQGFGKALFNAVIREAEARGLTEFTFHSTITGKDFYERQGCENCGPEDRVLSSGNRIQGYFMRKRIGNVKP